MSTRIRGFLLDIEGTLVTDKRYQPVGGAVAFISSLRQAGLPFRLITNNTTHTRDAIADMLRETGFDCTIEEVHTCIGAAATHLRSLDAKRCLVLGTRTLRNMLRDEGLAIVDASDVDAVVVGLDTDLTYERLQWACEAVSQRGAFLVALHRNRILVDSQGRPAPSVGAIVEAIVYATQVEPTVIGKPSPQYYRQALDDINLPAASVMVVSDDPLTDLAGAKQMGMQTAFVLTGKYRDRSVIESVAVPLRPDRIAETIAELTLDD